MLTISEALPKGFLEVSASELYSILPMPTLIHLPGQKPEPLFVSILLHGNEDVGLRAVQELLIAYQSKPLPRALSIYIGNVAAAREGLRRLPGQPDYNRIWPGCEGGDTPEHEMMYRVVEEMRRRRVFASVDLHNNTGINPQYACVNRLDHRFFRLATLFSRVVVYFLRPLGVQSMAFAPLCPAVTLECGKVGNPLGVSHAREYLDACLHLHAVPDHPLVPEDIDLFHTVATVRVPQGVNVSFDGEPADMQFVDNFEWLNFQELPAGTILATVNAGTAETLEVIDEQGRDITAEFIETGDGRICLKRSAMPAMFSSNETVIRQDCLGYLMERCRLPVSI